MTRSDRSWKLGLASFLLMGGAIASCGESVLAQITPDTTLGRESSTVTPTGSVDSINGGATRGANLFHSFGEFSIDEGRAAVFTNPAPIENILTRVTGANPSNILGTLGVAGNANLFLMNPNGIIFGSNARLDIGGSFVGTTANAIGFGDRGVFSATNKNIPSPLLTINPSALLFNQINQNAAIQNNSNAPAGRDPAGFNAFGLRVPNGKSLLLVGGNVSMDGGRLNANSGRVELGGLNEPGTVLLGIDGDNLSLIFPENVARADVSLTNSSGILVTGAGGGNIAVNARNLEILEETVLTAGIGQSLGTPETVAGDITLNATEEIKVAGRSIVRNLVRLGSRGNGGNITINSGSFSLTDGAQIAASTFGQGNAGNVIVGAKDAIDLANNASFISVVEAGGVGKGGNIDINAATLSLIDGAQVSASTREASSTQLAGRGDAGDVNINVTGAVNIAGKKNGFLSAIFSVVQTGTVGNGGNITIDSGSFSLSDGAQISAATRGQGNAGNVAVSAKDAVDLAFASILSTVEAGGVGKGGNIDINAATLSLIDGAQLQSATRRASNTQAAGRGDAGNINVKVTGAVSIAGEKNGFISGIASRVETGTVGNGGNITIDSGSFSLRDRAILTASTSGQGNAGNVIVGAKDVVNLAGNAYIFSTVEAGGVGKGGNIDINAATLSLIDGAVLLTLIRGASDTQPAGRGDAGDVNINVTGAVNIAGEKNGFLSAIFSRVETGTVDNGGNITIDSGSFSLRDGAFFTAETLGQGNAGTIKVKAADFITISGKSLNLNSGLFVNAQSTTGNAGDIIVTSPRVTLDNSGTLNAESALGNGGDINLQTDLLFLRRSAQISTTAGTVQASGNGGNINIDAPSGFIVAGARENSDITANAFNGQGGKVAINATGIFGIAPLSRQELERVRPNDLDPNQLPTNNITAISQTNPTLSGTIELNIPDTDLNSGLVNLPTVPVDTQVAQACTPGSSQDGSEFVVTGRGGLPPTPNDALNADAIAINWVTLPPQSDRQYNTATSTSLTTLESKPIIEAQGWIIEKNGQVVLTASASTATPHSSWQMLADCSS